MRNKSYTCIDDGTICCHASHETYNGWTNRETWAVSLYINNDEGMQRHALDNLRDIRADEKRARDASETLTVISLEDAIRYRFSDWLKDWFEEMQEQSIGATSRETLKMLFDIGSLSRVNWDELAEALKGD